MLKNNWNKSSWRLKKMWQADAFWAYSIALYQDDEIKRLCLHLQDDFSLNVNIILLCCYLNSKKCGLSGGGYVQLNHVQPKLISRLERYKKERKASKGNPGYANLLTQELELEKQHQKALISHLSGLSLILDFGCNLKAYANTQYSELPKVLITVLDKLVTLAKIVESKMLFEDDENK